MMSILDKIVSFIESRFFLIMLICGGLIFVLAGALVWSVIIINRTFEILHLLGF
jgi:hypothetical protein